MRHKDDKRYLALVSMTIFNHLLFQPNSKTSCLLFSLFFFGGGGNKKNLYVPKERIVTLIAATGCEGPSTMVSNPTYVVLSRFTCAMRGGVAKK